ncbi:MAG: cytochrome-c peroxidase [Flavobacteriales bacterium]
MNRLLQIAILIFFCSLIACERDILVPDNKIINLPLPEGFPPMPIPADNPFTQSKVDLGKKLFFDRILSKDSTISCGSCHFQQFAFAEDRPISVGIYGRLGFRNAQPLFNLAWNKHFFRDGGVPTLELSTLNPLDNHNEMFITIQEVLYRLNRHPKYPIMFRRAFNDTATAFGFLRAIAAFQRTLISGDSKYDQYKYYGGTLSELEKQGESLFFSEQTSCSTCHSGFNFTNNSFENNGLYLTYADSGRQRVTTLDADRGKFAVASLRNVQYTAPYMHDGSLQTLDEVIEHYNSGGQAHSNKSELIRPLNLSEEEKQALKAFLLTLSDENFIRNQIFKP